MQDIKILKGVLLGHLLLKWWLVKTMPVSEQCNSSSPMEVHCTAYSVRWQHLYLRVESTGH